MENASRFCVSSLRRGHANLLCIVPILVYVHPKMDTEKTIFWVCKPNKIVIMCLASIKRVPTFFLFRNWSPRNKSNSKLLSHLNHGSSTLTFRSTGPIRYIFKAWMSFQKHLSRQTLHYKLFFYLSLLRFD